MLFQVKPKVSETLLQLVIPRPWTHVDDIFENQPSGLERASVLDDMHSRSAAGFVPWRRSLGTGVIATFRRREKDIDPAHLLLKGADVDFLQPAGHNMGIWEIGRVCRCRSGTHVDAGHHLDTRGPGSGATASCPAENITSPHCAAAMLVWELVGVRKSKRFFLTHALLRVWHSQMINTRHPSLHSESTLLRSLATLPRNFSVQNRTLDFGE